MPRKAVKSLYQIALVTVYQSIWNFTIEHQRSFCGTCLLPYQCSECSSVKKMKQTLSLLPVNVAQDIYNVNIDFIWESSIGFKRFLFLHLLYTPELKIQKFWLTRTDDLYFAVKFGRSIQSIFFEESPRELYQNELLWQTFMFCVSNIHTLNLASVTLSDSLLERVGRECFHLKVLDRLELVKNKYSSQLFKGLCLRYQDGKYIQNHCCKNLELIDVWKYWTFRGCWNEPTVLQNEMNKFVPFLFVTLPNLKSLGDSFDASMYLNSIDSRNIRETSMECANVSRLTPLLKVMCPYLRQLRVLISAPRDVVGLDSFKYLEKLTITNTVGREYPLNIPVNHLYKDVLCCQWDNLTEFSSSYPMYALKICVLANYLPCLETLRFRNFVTTEWDCVSHFKSLKKAHFVMYEVQDISWVSSFSQTIKVLRVDKAYPSTVDVFNNVSCAIFTTVHFPLLEELHISKFSYDFQFITNIIQHCSMLRKFEIPLNYEEITELSDFVTQNNFDVVFRERC